jgi:hypothetical protein
MPAGGRLHRVVACGLCYTTEEAHCSAGMQDAIEYSPAASENVVLFGACFAPGSVPVTHQGG